MAAQVWFERIAAQAAVTLPYAGWQEGFHYWSIFVITINRCYVLAGKLNMVPEVELRVLTLEQFTKSSSPEPLDGLIWGRPLTHWGRESRLRVHMLLSQLPNIQKAHFSHLLYLKGKVQKGQEFCVDCYSRYLQKTLPEPRSYT